ncbi:MAG: hypothetical protein Q8Q31_00845 [Nanoarchaeota archaeon]|nr:hypothetical protein [Nanoarchaeota archaeon]
METNERTESPNYDEHLRSSLDSYDSSSEGALPLATLLLGEERFRGKEMYRQRLQDRL